MNERQQQILAAVVKEYTETGMPVGSNILADRYKFNVSTATLRSDMAQLEEEKLLFQPHTSAGRVPTDAGYRYFVEEIMPERELSKKEQQAMQKELLQLRAQNTRLTRTTAKLLSTLSGNVAISGRPDSDDFFECGLRTLLEEGKDADMDELCQMAEALDYIDEKCDVIMKELGSNETKIFIGEENPISDAKNYSMVVSRYDVDGEEGIVALIGPKNMKYEKNKSLINYVKKILGSSSTAMIVVIAGTTIIIY